MYQRFRVFDRLKAIFLLGVVFVHSAIFLYKGIDNLDFNNPPVVVIILSLLVSWGGMFIVVSCLVNNYTLLKKVENGDIHENEIFKHVWVYVAFLLLLHPVYTILVGPTTFDFGTGHHKYTAFQELVRFGAVSHLRLDKLLECSIFTAIGANLLITAGVSRLYLALRKKIQVGRFYAWGFAAAVLFLATGYFRMLAFEPFWEAREAGNMWAAAAGFLFFDKPYPLFPYLSFGLVGGLAGIMLANQAPKNLVKKYTWWIGGMSALAGITGYIFLPKSANAVDPTWLCKVLIEFGLFNLILGGIYPGLNVQKAQSGQVDRLLREVSLTSLSLYMIQQPLTELFAKILDGLFKDWSLSINNMLLFGLFNVLVWVGLLWAVKGGLRQIGVERLWALFSAQLKRPSYRVRQTEKPNDPDQKILQPEPLVNI